MVNKTQTDEEQLIQQIKEFKTFWDNGDAEAISLLFTKDSKRVGAFGEIQNGPFEIQETYKMLLGRAFPDTKLLMGENTIRFLADNLAVLQGSFEISSSDKKIKGYLVLVMKKENNKWMILEMHPKIFPLQDQTSL